MYFSNLFVAAATFVLIGLFHPIVIKTQYHIGTHAWPVFALFGAVFLTLSVFVGGTGGILCAVVGCSCLWSILELFEQEKRVEKGWFPKKPGKKEKSKACPNEERAAFL